jgi:hypothetical protein
VKRLVVVVALLGAAWLAPQAAGGLFLPSITVTPVGNGAGTVTGTGTVDGPIINCSRANGVNLGDCQEINFTENQQITITAIPAAGSTFGGWAAPGCIGAGGVQTVTPTGGTCTLGPFSPTTDITLFPVFTLVTKTLTVAKTGTGSGTVTSNPAGINCGPVCSATFPGTQNVVTLTAAPAPGSVIGVWGGACAGSGSNPVCILPLGAGTTTVTITFTARPLFTLTVGTGGTGSGTVTSTPAGISCPPTCAAQVVGGTTVTLNANPAPGSTFTGFTGACSGSTCVLTVNAAASVTANFALTRVQAALEDTFMTRTGPRNARRVLNIVVSADEPVEVDADIIRGGRVLQSRVYDVGAGDRTLRFPIRNGIAAGRATLRITFENQFGVEKTQSRRIRIRPL